MFPALLLEYTLFYTFYTPPPALTYLHPSIMYNTYLSGGSWSQSQVISAETCGALKTGKSITGLTHRCTVIHIHIHMDNLSSQFFFHYLNAFRVFEGYQEECLEDTRPAQGSSHSNRPNYQHVWGDIAHHFMTEPPPDWVSHLINTLSCPFSSWAKQLAGQGYSITKV